MPCSTPGIPNGLHRNGRLVDPDFSQDYKLFVRVHPDHIIENTDHSGNSITQVSVQAFTSNKQSCNRDKYSVALDVLYNINAQRAEDHYENWGVVSLGVAELTNRVFPHPVIHSNFGLIPVHAPEECMYAHCEIDVYDISGNVKNSVQVNSKLLKAAIKGHYLDVLTIEINPHKRS